MKPACFNAVVTSLAACLLFGSANGLTSRIAPPSSWSNLFNSLRHQDDSFETCVKQSQQGKSKPVVGILTVPNFDDDVQYAILGSGRVWKPYVDWLKEAGADIVPLPYTGANLTEKLSHVNAVLFPGGHNHFVIDGELTKWGQSAKEIWTYAMASNRAGKPMPIWGICLGFEAVNYMASAEKWTPFVSKFETENNSLNEHYTPYAAHSRLLNGKCAPKGLQSSLASHAWAFHTHSYGIEPSHWDKVPELSSTLNIVSTTHGPDGREFVSMVEGKDGLPVYGTQWHPEKNEFLTEHDFDIKTSTRATEAMSYFAHFFVEEARRNNNQFPSPEDREDALIENYFNVETELEHQSPEMYYVGDLKPMHVQVIWRRNCAVILVSSLVILSAILGCWLTRSARNLEDSCPASS
eukprot:TRINITY_DN932_c0_g2_i3.p1 TRINITY_DN932_c0_g2~~TRINITY_DN932_c0_g2_i3.p1  ORF type:complete len:408 (+),score=31.48 TRINITY_DN932_c0_g2_i3:45-1268(+)